ncbi:c-type cytochrome [Salaquimonas pukyongi]|uniref:c-type cytochrome n=1 Tax=Salaquimonas pukyongi TaxID=2712698 RepID=UPI0009F99A06|nr:c-type cytochrome [Salaquimonas pukyongi]
MAVPPHGVFSAIAAILSLFLVMGKAQAADFYTLKGHGGPVMDVAVSAHTGDVASASFDNSVGLWRQRNPKWLEGHEAAVNVVEIIGPDKLASGGDDFSIVIWDLATGSHQRLAGHKGKVIDLAVSPDKRLLASASWDGSIGLWPLDQPDEEEGANTPVFLQGHTAGVNALAFSSDGRTLYSASVDGTIRLWDLTTKSAKQILVQNGFGINVIALGGQDDAGKERWIAYGTVDGITRIIDLGSGREIQDFTLDRRPILSMALNADGKRLATGDGHGYITVFETRNWRIERDFKAALRGPIWALAFSPDGSTILAGGIENIVYAWPIESLSEHQPMAASTPSFLRSPREMDNGERQFARKCSICHSLTGGSARKAGPSLHRLFGRKAGTLPGYNYSDTLVNSKVVWNETTVDLLFAEGPDVYVPGSKMPMQRITGPQDRKDLVDFLKEATR